MQLPEPAPQHVWLQRLIGEWRTFSPEGTPAESVFEGRETGSALGEIWVQIKGDFPMGETPGSSVSTLGYDPRSGRFVGSWIGNMMTHHWVYDGEMSPDGESLILECEGPAFDGSGNTDRYRDTLTFEGPNRRRLTASVLGSDGEWRDFMVTLAERIE
jgi:hypothetical protein